MRIKKKLLLSPLVIVILIIIFGVTAAGAAIFIGAGSGTSTSIDLQKGLVGWWKMDGNAMDSTPYQHNGTLTGTTQTTDRKGTANKAYDFDGGASTNISVSDTTGSSLDLTTAVTVSVWVNVQTTGTKGIVSKGGAGGNSPLGPYSLWTIGTTIYWEVGDGAANTSINSTLTAGVWTHWVGTYSNSTLTLYKDGAKVKGPTGVAVSSMVQNNNALLFADSAGTVTNLDALMDDVRIYNRALSSAEIIALYDSYNPSVQISDLQKGLLGQWKMDGNTKDSTTYESNGTTAGTNIALTTDRKGQSSKAYSFNGSDDIIRVDSLTATIKNDTQGTIVAWAKLDAVGANNLTLMGGGRSDDSNDGRFQWFLRASDGKFGIFFRVDGSNYIGWLTDDNIGLEIAGDGKWHHFAIVSDGSSYKNYIDGVERASSITGQLGSGAVGDWMTDIQTATFSRAGIGANRNQTEATFWDGDMDDVRIYNRALSATEITGLYQEYDPGIQVSNLQKGLIGQWKLDGNAMDSTPYENNGTLTGTTQTTDRKGQANKAYSFDGSTTDINMGDPSNGSLETSSAMSISAWIKTGTISASKFIASKWDGTNGFRLYYYNTNYLNLFVGAQNGQISVDLEDSLWHLVVGTWDGTSTRIYVDGVLPAGGTDATGTTLAANTGSFRVGFADGGAAGDHWAGSIDDVRYYNRTLSQTEITALYESY